MFLYGMIRVVLLPHTIVIVAGSSQGSLCIVTELLSRGSLEDVIQAGALRTASYRLILHLALQVSFRLTIIW